MVEPRSIVHWFPEKDSSKCGYCKNSSGSVQNGMWAQSLSVEDYQNLIDRGWRRSGQYCYKPVMNETCCPLYTIRCNSLDFHVTKSQKKVIKKVNKFLKTGILKDSGSHNLNEVNVQEQGITDNYRECPRELICSKSLPQLEVDHEIGAAASTLQRATEKKCVSNQNRIGINEATKCINDNQATSSKLKPKEGKGADPNRPPCRKAKAIRLEKKLKKLENSDGVMDQSNEKHQQSKSLEEFMNEISGNDKYTLSTKIVEPSNSNSEWKKYEELEFELFKKYQNIIHDEPPSKHKLEGFLRFLVNTPLQREKPKSAPTNCLSYGSYHQQYWLNDKLIAVGVIDVLPKCISAVYFFYDPDYRELTLGTYGALKEIQLSRELYSFLNTQYYYMGYYINSCKKMKYKGNMHPSFLLCPETYEWFPIEKCLEKLDKTKYCRFTENEAAVDHDECTAQDLDDLQIVVGNRYMTYRRYKNFYSRAETFENIGKLVGKKCVINIIFIES